MSFWAYMLHCRGGAYYTGHTDDLEKRISEHQGGLIEGFTSARLPVELVWSQEFPTRIEALEAEQRIKGWSRKKKMALIRGDWDEISMLAKAGMNRKWITLWFLRRRASFTNLKRAGLDSRPLTLRRRWMSRAGERKNAPD